MLRNQQEVQSSVKSEASVGPSLDQSSSRWLHIWCSPDWTMVARHWLICLHGNSTDYSPPWILPPDYTRQGGVSVSPLLQGLHWLRVPEWIDFRLAVLVYRCINDTAPRYQSIYIYISASDSVAGLYIYFDSTSPVSYNGLPTLSRVDACDLHRQRCCTFHGRCTRPSATVPSPLPAARVWNMLPPAITSLPSLQTFKRALKTELFRRPYDNAH